AETIYEDGLTVRTEEIPANMMVAFAVSSARAQAGMSQTELSAATGIDQSDISKIERGVANPSVSTLSRIADALGARLSISIG
ncbi:MAG: helix-turn-helix transcriptional regulator, partial [Clostridia bacterium]|nr:helix-turn-helix transcriptional regulator [Clostridia bacterium]